MYTETGHETTIFRIKENEIKVCIYISRERRAQRDHSLLKY